MTTLISFGIRYGIPQGLDALVSCKTIRNPHRDVNLRMLRGTDALVQNKVLAHQYAEAIIARILKHVQQKQTIGVYCTAGHHRSVAIVEEVARRLICQGQQVLVHHRDLER
jgi:UPF0042 nucleotide-binding protein